MKQNPILTEKEDHDNPLGMLTNLFDVAMVFAVAVYEEENSCASVRDC